MSASFKGIVNQYSPVIELAGKSIVLGGATHPFRPYDRVLLIQMAGAEIDLSNSANFGTINQLKSAGCYEWARVGETDGQRVTLTQPLRGSYDPHHGKVQLVRVATADGDVSIVGTIEATAWDGSVGGVVVIEASGTIELLADLDVSGKGFRGGQVSPNVATTADKVVDFVCDGKNNAGFKGEGIALLPEGSRTGRGAPGNGAGGANKHNASGGGGGNGGSGGLGGIAYAATEPNDTGGVGGRALNFADRLFLGGGGGGGEQNQLNASPGGNGGGIVLLRARQVTGSAGRVIRANGLDSWASAYDGPGGAGAGGTIVIDASAISGSLALEARGGTGGKATWSGSHTGGGGGGGGTIRTRAALPSSVSATIAGGASGLIGPKQAADRDGSSGIIGLLAGTTAIGPSPGEVSEQWEELTKSLAEQNRKVGALEAALSKCGGYEEKLAAHAAQLASLQAELNKCSGCADKLSAHEARLAAQDKKLAEQDHKLAELAAKTSQCDACEQKLGAQARTIDELDKKLAELAAKTERCGACEEKIGAQSKTIDELTGRIAELAKKLEEKITPPAPPSPPEPPKPTPADDLEVVEGIGPKIAELLKEANIRTYKQLAATDVHELQKVLKAGGTKFARNDPSSWPKQAQLIAEGRKADLKAYQDSLNAGRSKA